MNGELTLLLLRLAFLTLLWLFVFGIVYALRTDLFGQRVRRMPADQGQQQAAAAPAPQVSPFQASPGMPAPARQSAPISSLPDGPNTSRPGHEGPIKATTASARRIVITGGPRAGLEIALQPEPLTIGRSSESGLVIRDDYTSTHHARLLLWNDEWMIQDLDSTNGTFLAGKRVHAPVQVPLNTPIKVGATTFELRR
ncbi:FHA domain-containing protein [Microbacteriaceae bacterium 4G12]